MLYIYSIYFSPATSSPTNVLLVVRLVTVYSKYMPSCYNNIVVYISTAVLIADMLAIL